MALISFEFLLRSKNATLGALIYASLLENDPYKYSATYGMTYKMRTVRININKHTMDVGLRVYAITSIPHSSKSILCSKKSFEIHFDLSTQTTLFVSYRIRTTKNA